MTDSHAARPFAVLLIEPAGGLAATLHDHLLGSFSSCLDIGVARSLREAMRHLATHQVDVVLMDLALPDYKGADAVRALRLTAPTCALIALSAGGDERALLEALRAGAHEILSILSLASRDLRLAVERAVVRAQHQPGRTAPPPPPQPPFASLPARLLHDLNNAMTSINGFADVLLARMPAGDPARGPVEQIRKAGLRAAALLTAASSPPQPPPASDAPATDSTVYTSLN